MNERIIQREVRRYFANYEYILFNTFIFAWESDFFAISKSGYSVEVEVKISKADFKKDFTKASKHNLLSNHKQQVIVHSRYPFRPALRKDEVFDIDTYPYRAGSSSSIYFTKPAEHIPNKFYYACPENLLCIDDIPAYAGLIYIRTFANEFGTYHDTIEVKKAPLLHRVQKDFKATLLSKYYWKHKNDRVEVLTFLNDLERSEVVLQPNQLQIINQLREKYS